MPGIDRIFADRITQQIKKSIEKEDLKKLERQIFTKYGLSIKLAVENFQIIDHIMKGLSIKSTIIKNIFKQIFSIKEHSTGWIIKIKDNQLSELLLKEISDEESMKILRLLMNDNLTIESIIRKTNIPKTTAYRKTQTLLKLGLVVILSRVKTKTRFTTNITCLFKKISYSIEKEKIVLTFVVSDKIYQKSSIKDFI